MTTRNRVEKLALNNQIVKMRKDVKRARLWLINDLNRRVKKLNRPKAKECDLEKNQLKAENLRVEIQLLKHIDVDEVSKFALCNKQESPNQLMDVNGLDMTSMTQTVMLKLANHKIVQEQVKMFRQFYGVPIDRLVLLIRSLGLQYNKKKKQSLLGSAIEENTPKEMERKKKLVSKKKVLERQKMFQQLIHSPKSSTISGECLHDSSAEEDSNSILNFMIKEKSGENVSSLKIEAPVKIGPSQISQPLQGNCLLSPHNNLETVQNGPISTTDQIVKKQFKSKVGLNQKIPWSNLLAHQINKKFGTMIVKQLNLENEAETIIVDKSHKALHNIPDSNETPIDSFFLGGVDLPCEGEDETKNNNHLDSLRVHTRKNFGKKASLKKTLCKLSCNISDLTNGPTLIKQAAKTSPVSTHEVLHPSWQAKRKEKEFQIKIGGNLGKKIRFDED